MLKTAKPTGQQSLWIKSTSSETNNNRPFNIENSKASEDNNYDADIEIDIDNEDNNNNTVKTDNSK